MQIILFVLVCSIYLVSCVINYCPQYNKPTVSDGGDRVKSFLAFSAKLISKFENKAGRLVQLPAALLAENADVVCLNEVFLQNDISTIFNNVKHKYPYVYSSIHDGTTNNFLTANSSPCPFFLRMKLLVCMVQCAGITDIKGIIECDKENKCNAWKNLKQECITCAGAVGAIHVTSCVKKQQVNVAGNMILSKYPITKAESTFFVSDKQANRQGKLIVEIAGRTIACTKMQTALSDAYYEPETKQLFSSSWALENLSQAKCILSNFEQQEKVILMGDLECGPAIPSNNIRKDHEVSYNNLTVQFDSPYVSDVGQKTSRGANIITSHVMQKGYNGHHSCSRVLGGKYNGIELSNQFGVKCTIAS
ncbi:uncharacterized protein LOC127724295 [Mytilus californianus]|uniref:uncharacterized protein LOC127724295 n=1 Tax=Mytilus californianus TaxID=6549 RepID=UPI0022467425|nr:uncharacterized protein LOC127724295 [Mytilus californianus]